MAETLLITIDDCRQYRQLSKNINQQNFDSHVLSAQRVHLHHFLGAAFYKDLVENATSEDNEKLLNGTDYLNYSNESVLFFGLKEYLSWLVLSDLIVDNDMKISDLGNITYKDIQFDLAEGDTKRESKSSYKQMAESSKNKAIEFLDSNRDKYPLWKSEKEKVNIVDFDFKVI